MKVKKNLFFQILFIITIFEKTILNEDFTLSIKTNFIQIKNTRSLQNSQTMGLNGLEKLVNDLLDKFNNSNNNSSALSNTTTLITSSLNTLSTCSDFNDCFNCSIYTSINEGCKWIKNKCVQDDETK